nr:hypothetical protein [Tanacetum cinerariifolium]
MSNINNTMQTHTSNTLHNAIMEAGGQDRPPMLAPVAKGSSETTTERYIENYKNVSQDIRDQLNVEPEAVQIILIGIDNDIYFTVDACPNACEMWKSIERLKQGESINVQDLETNLYWEFRKFTSRDGESLESYYSRFYKMTNELNEVNEIRAERLARTANLLALVAQQQPVYHPQNHPTHYTQNSSTRSQQAATRNKGKAIVNSPPPIYDQEPTMVAEDDEIANQDNSLRINIDTGYDNQRIVNIVGTKENVGTPVVQQSGIQCYNCKEYGHVARECQKPKRAKDVAYHKEKMLLYQELEAHYMYMAQIQEVTLDAADNSGPIFDSEPLQKVSNNDNYNVFAIGSEHLEQSKSVNDTYLIEQDKHNVIIDSLDMSYDREQIDQNNDANDLANERDLLASLIEKLKCEINDSKNRNKFLETSNKALIDKLKGKIKDFKTKNKSLESSNNHFKEANNELSKTNQLMYKDLKKFQAELDRYHDVKYASKVEIDCEKTKGDLMSYKMESEKSFNEYTRKMPMAVPHSTREPKRIVNQSVATPLRRTVASESTNQQPRHTTRKLYESVKIILFIVDSGCSKHMTGNLKLLTNFVEKFLGTVKFGNDQIAPILGYGDLTTPSSKRRLQLLHMDLCGPMRVESINGKKYVLVIVDDYSRYTWTHFLRSKDETPEVLIDFLKLVQRGLHAQVKTVRTDKGSEFLNKTLHAYFAFEGILHQTSIAQTPEQNGVVERQNRTLVEAARTMLSATKVPLYFWAEAIATACFTQNRSLVIPRHEKTTYHIINDRKPSVKFFHMFGSLCYIIRDGENLDKMKKKGDACIFVGYSTLSRAYRVFNKRTRVLVETIHVNFDELPHMASDHVSSNPVPQCQRTTLEHDNLSPGPQCKENVPQAAGIVTMSNELDLLFSPMFDELLNGSTQVVSNSFAVTTADAPNQCQQQHTTPLITQTTLVPTCQVPTQTPAVMSTKNINQAETITENVQVEDDEFINIFCTPVQDRGEL